ncbi:MAG: DedA family protein [Candidatus Marsarchaeota archaeon]|nr:DedA family protein [Candidatus Marsarchaeota archaeon]MCL5102102.1 DedA family protein [Candidatus Marsarchaeota archaeon]
MLDFITLSIIATTYKSISLLMAEYGYLAIFGLMLLEGSSLPVPSEVVLPLAGVLVAQHTLSLAPAYLAALLGSIAGLAIDYYIGYFLGKDVVYKHLSIFHIKKESLDAFDRWFEKNGVASVFFTRFIPVLRTLMSFPAGFARMSQKKFYAYSILGTGIYDIVLILFGLKALSTNNAVITLTSIGVFAIALYLVYAFAVSKMMKK